MVVRGHEKTRILLIYTVFRVVLHLTGKTLGREGFGRPKLVGKHCASSATQRLLGSEAQGVFEIKPHAITQRG
ncbi:hypothetical protein CBP33_10575 [Acidovorax carolinensis]|nr:hypothetical protein CBP33_10575 [Acidovorax carolinensis]